MDLCIIPARGGSKRIPKKNIYKFAGKPMISWSIKTAIESDIFDKVVVSTDNELIADISIKNGAEVPFLRPKELSDDMTPTQPVIEHAIKWFEKIEVFFENVCCLYATAPLLIKKDLVNSKKLLSKSNKNSMIFSSSTYDYPIQRAMTLNKEGEAVMLNPENINKRSQDLIETFHDAGQFYWARSERWLKYPSIFKYAVPFNLPRYRTQDIDSLEDLQFAEILFKILKEKI